VFHTSSIRVDQLRDGDRVTGTGASGDYDDGPRILVSRTPALEHSVRTQAWWLVWDDGGHNVYYGDTAVTAVTMVGAR
jgi:hypothetical protein